MQTRRLFVPFALALALPARSSGTGAAEVEWLRVHLDHFEFAGNTYKSRGELVAALRSYRNKGNVSLNWVIPKNEADRQRMAAQVKEAHSAAKEAGLTKITAVANEVF